MAETKTIEDEVLAHLRALPVEQQQEVLDFVEFLGRKHRDGLRRSARGIWADLDVQITDEDIAEVRKQMAEDFGRGLKD